MSTPPTQTTNTQTTNTQTTNTIAADALRIDYIELPATDLPATKRFYTEAFGWSFTDYGPDYASFADGRLNGGFTTETRVVGGGGALVILFAKDLEGALARVTRAGGRVVKDIFSFPGGRRFHFADPSGNELAVWSDT
jgi:predicted enzyme related to lactoylglutathione lyase